MKNKTLFSLVALFVVCLNVLPTLAQDTERKTELWINYDMVVKPSMVNECEAVVKDMVAKDTKYKLGYQYYTVSTEDFHYSFKVQLENYGDFDNYLKAWNVVATKMGVEQHQALYNRFAGTYESYSVDAAYRRYDLSYSPENPRLKWVENNFVVTDYFYIKAGKEEEFEKVMKELIALIKSKNIPEMFQAYVVAIGPDMPVYFVQLRGKSASDFWIHNEKMWEILGKEGELLFGKMKSLARKRDLRQGWYRPNLSYIPEEQ